MSPKDIGLEPAVGRTHANHSINSELEGQGPNHIIISFVSTMVIRLRMSLNSGASRDFRCAARPAPTCRSGGRHLGKFVWGFSLALVFEAMQSRPMTTSIFPKVGMTIQNKILLNGLVSLVLQNGEKEKNYNINKWQVWIRVAFLGQILASHGIGAMVGWHFWQNMPNLYLFAFMQRTWYIISQIKPK